MLSTFHITYGHFHATIEGVNSCAKDAAIIFNNFFGSLQRRYTKPSFRAMWTEQQKGIIWERKHFVLSSSIKSWNLELLSLLEEDKIILLMLQVNWYKLYKIIENASNKGKEIREKLTQ